jgi:hypothetical protein
MKTATLEAARAPACLRVIGKGTAAQLLNYYCNTHLRGVLSLSELYPFCISVSSVIYNVGNELAKSNPFSMRAGNEGPKQLLQISRFQLA